MCPALAEAAANAESVLERALLVRSSTSSSAIGSDAYSGLELRAQPGLSSLPGFPLCLDLVLILLDLRLLHQRQP